MARAARACVSEMLPPPIRPMRIVMRPSVSAIGRDKLFVGRFGGFGGEDRRRDQDAVAEGRAGMRSQGKIQLFFAIAESFLAQRIGGEKAVAAGVPVGGKTGILGVIENGDGDGFTVNDAAWGTRGRWCNLSGMVNGEPVTMPLRLHQRPRVPQAASPFFP